MRNAMVTRELPAWVMLAKRRHKFAAPAVEWPRTLAGTLSVLRLHACAAAAFIRARFRTAQVARHFAIVDPLLVVRLAAEPLLGGADRLDAARFAVRTQYRTGCS